ncbi:DNA recombination protein [Escherichia coli]|nr:DNA recombination protein [Escherichia coli]
MKGMNTKPQVSIENDARSRMQPDVIVRLPQGKDVVIDAKMTLVAYERYFNAEDDYTRESALQEHIASVRNHIRLLGRKLSTAAGATNAGLRADVYPCGTRFFTGA